MKIFDQERSRFLAAARALFTGVHDPAAGPAGLVVGGGGTLRARERDAFAAAARGSDIDVLRLEFGPRSEDGPRRVAVMLPREGKVFIHTDCVFWADEGADTVMIVPRKVRASHFVFHDGEIEHRPGRPAEALGPGMARANALLRARAAAATDAEQANTYDVHMLKAAA